MVKIAPSVRAWRLAPRYRASKNTPLAPYPRPVLKYPALGGKSPFPPFFRPYNIFQKFRKKNDVFGVKKHVF